MDRRLNDVALGVTVLATTAIATRVVTDAVTTGWGAGRGLPLEDMLRASSPLIAVLVGPLLGGWLARRGHAREVLLIGVGLLTAILAVASFTKLKFPATLADWGVPYLFAGAVLGAVLVHAVAPQLKTRRPQAGLLAALWAATVLVTVLGSGWLREHAPDSLFVWVGAVAVAGCLVPVPFDNVKQRPRDPGLGPLLQLLLGVAVLAAVAPLIQPIEPGTPLDLALLYAVMLAIAAYTLYASLRLLSPALAAVALTGVVLIGTAYQLTVQLGRAKVHGVSGVFALAGLLGAAAAVGLAFAPERVRRPMLLVGPGLALLGLLATLDIGGKPKFALWSMLLIAVGSGLTLGAALHQLNRTGAALAGGVLVVSVVGGVKLGQGIRVLNLVTQGTPGAVLAHWFAVCAVLIAVAGWVGYRAQRSFT